MGGVLHAIHNRRGKEVLQNLVDFLKEAQEKGFSKEEVVEEVNKNTPELIPLLNSFPKTRAALDSGIAILIIAIFSYLARQLN